MAYTPDSELDREYLTTDTTQTITGNKTFDGSSTFNSSLVVNPTSPFYVKNNKIRFYTSGTEYGWIGTNGATDVRIDVSNGGELLTNYTPVSADGITNKSYVDNSISSAVVGSAVYKGAWNASTNTPDLTSVAKAQGDFYIVSVAGTTSIDGVNEWSVGDWILFNGTAWEKVDNSQTIPVNIGTGAQVFKSLNAVSNQADFRTLVGGSIISLTQNADDITINDSNVAGTNVTNTFNADQNINGVLNLGSTTNSPITNGDIWNDGNNLIGVEDSTNFNLSGLYGVSTETDLNNYTQDGKYLTPSTALTNAPAGFTTSSRRLIQVSQYALGTSNYIAQTLYSINDNKVAWRVYATASWSEWHEVPYMVDDVLKLQSTTNGSPVNGDIYLDSSVGELMAVDSGNDKHALSIGLGYLNGAVDAITDGDAQTYTKFFRTSATWTGSPYSGTNGDNQGYLLNLNAGSPLYGTQLFLGQDGWSQGEAKVRCLNNGTWGDWQNIFISKDGANGVLPLRTATNSSPSNGDIWYDGTNVNVQGDVVIDTSTTESALKFQRSNINNWWIRSRSTNTLRFSAYDEATGSFLNSPIEIMPFELSVNGKIGLASTTNGSPTPGDIWYDGTNVNIEESLKVLSNGTALSLVGTNHTYIGFYPDGGGRKGYIGYGNPGSLDLYIASEESGKDLLLRTLNGKVDIDDTIRFSGTLTDNGTSTTGKHMLVRDDSTGDVQLASVTSVKTKTITLEAPTTSDTEIPIWYTDEALTVSEIFYECINGTSVTFNVKKKANLGDAGTNVNTSAITATTTKGSTTALSGASVTADNYLALNVTAKSGSVDYVSVTIKYTVV